MAYVDGFVIPVPQDRMDDYKALAALCAQVWKEHGARASVECIGDDVPYGTLTSFPRGVQARDDERIVFSWIVYESRASRDAVMEKVMADPRMKSAMENGQPFDGKRMIFGGFQPFLGPEPVSSLGGVTTAYIDGFAIPVPTDKLELYKEMAYRCQPVSREYGAIGHGECIGDDVPYGEVTSFPRAVQAEAGETIIFSWVVWPTKAQRDAGNAKIQEDPRLKDIMENPSFNPKRMIFGGFVPFLGL